jgi:restriction endonuclease S subunit
VKVEADGFDLGAQRRPIDRNDLPDALNTLHAWRDYVIASHEVAKQSPNDEEVASSGSAPSSQRHGASFSPTMDSALLVSTSRLAENDDYNLSADRYREVTRIGKQTYPLVKLGDVFETSSGGTPLRSKNEYYEGGTIPWVKSGEVAQGFVTNTEEKITELGLKNSSAKIFPVNTVLVAMYGATAGQVGLLKIEATTNQAVCGIFPNDKIIPEFLYQILKSKTDYMISLGSGGAQPNISQAIIRNLEIPLPPLETQRQIVDEIAAHQRIIDGARQVVDGWKPFFEVNHEWEVVGLDSLCSIKHGFAFKGEDFSKSKNTKLPIVLTPGNFAEEGGLYFNDRNTKRFSGKVDKEYLFCKGDLVIVMTDLSSKMKILGNPAIIETDNILHNQRIGKVILHSDKVLVEYLHLALFAQDVKGRIQRTATGTLIKHTSPSRILECKIPLPPLEVQREIVARIERERSIVEGNRELIRIYEEKVKKVIERVWEG